MAGLWLCLSQFRKRWPPSQGSSCLLNQWAYVLQKVGYYSSFLTQRVKMIISMWPRKGGPFSVLLKSLWVFRQHPDCPFDLRRGAFMWLSFQAAWVAAKSTWHLDAPQQFYTYTNFGGKINVSFVTTYADLGSDVLEVWALSWLLASLGGSCRPVLFFWMLKWLWICKGRHASLWARHVVFAVKW